ncbi:hypothetical protein C0J52_16988 [Blattella germanica]|nr:hypothetical protein C0J52_16988 [Blattella germanica]
MFQVSKAPTGQAELGAWWGSKADIRWGRVWGFSGPCTTWGYDISRSLTPATPLDSSSAASSESNTKGEGLTDFGKLMVREMNRLGMLVDLSHAAHETVLAVLEITRSPVIFSHSSAQAICNTSRNVPDHVLKLVAENGGLVMVSFYTDFLTCSTSARMEDEFNCRSSSQASEEKMNFIL